MKILYLINATGLIFDILGVILLFNFGLPPTVNRKGQSAILMEGTDNAEIEKGKLYDKLSWVALGCILAGFFLQFAVCIAFVKITPS